MASSCFTHFLSAKLGKSTKAGSSAVPISRLPFRWQDIGLMDSPQSSGSQRLPQIARVVLPELARLRAARQLSSRDFEVKVTRLIREEFAPRNLSLLICDLPGGATRFIVRDMHSHAVYDLLDCEGPGNGVDSSEVDGVSLPDEDDSEPDSRSN